MSNELVKVQVLVDRELHKRFKLYCAYKGVSIQTLLLEYIEKLSARLGELVKDELEVKD